MSDQRLCSVRMAAAAHIDEEDPQPGEVCMGKFSTSNGARIFTNGLATCVRVAVTGRYPNGGSNNGDDRFLAHVAESRHKSALQGLIDAVERAKGNGMQVVEVVVLILAADEGSPDAEQDDFNEEVIERVQNAIGMQQKVVEHTENYKMSVEANKRINYVPE
ncbi:hypothetical protein FVER53590_05915 [Fusarium verticillioides]|nr:hypothetical protein FVER53590_05915 [Fusarium verticillioides]